MRLYRTGSSGEPVRDIQDRLAALGFESEPDPRGEFGSATSAAVLSFQHARGLDPDGIVGPDTWRALYEAGYRLGDRLLFLRRPMLRGEDVVELQSRLNGLGFDAGKPDGIYGPDTERSVREFQQNRGLSEDGVAGPEVVTEIRLVTRGPIRAGRETIREREWMRSLHSVVGIRVSFDPAARDHDEALEAATAAAIALQERGGMPILSRAIDERLPERIRARRANRRAADVIISFQRAEIGDDSVFFFETQRNRSEAGAALASHIAAQVGARVSGRATAILTETRSPAVVVSCASLDAEIGEATVRGLERFVEDLGQAKKVR
jgi:N-acetylmuramoyl-L-alanine amidase